MQLSKLGVAVMLVLCTFALSSIIGIAAAEEPYRFVTSWEMKAPGDATASLPLGIVISPSGIMYVSAAYDNRILKFSTDGAYLGAIAGSGEFVMKAPDSLALDASGNLYVVDHDEGESNIVNDNLDRILIIAPDGSFTKKPGGAYERGYDRIDGIAIGRDNQLFVSNNPNYGPTSELIIHTPASSGDFPETITTHGSGQVVTAPNGDVYQLDQFDEKMLVFKPDGTLTNSWPVTNVNGGTFWPMGLAIGPDGNLFISDYFSDSGVMKFTSSGTLLTHWGTKGTTPGSFDGASFIATDALGNVYVADGYNNRIQKFAPAGAAQPVVTTIPTLPPGTLPAPSTGTYVQARTFYISAAGSWSQAWGASDMALIRQYLNQAKSEYTNCLNTASQTNDPANAANLALVKSVSGAYIALADAALAMYGGADVYGTGRTQMSAGSYAAAAASFQAAGDSFASSQTLFGQATTTLQSVSYAGTEYGDGTAYTAVIVPILNTKAAYMGEFATYARGWQHTALAYQARGAGDQATFRSEAQQAMNLFDSLRSSVSFGADAAANYNVLAGLLGSSPTPTPSPTTTATRTPTPTVSPTRSPTATPTEVSVSVPYTYCGPCPAGWSGPDEDCMCWKWVVY